MTLQSLWHWFSHHHHRLDGEDKSWWQVSHTRPGCPHLLHVSSASPRDQQAARVIPEWLRLMHTPPPTSFSCPPPNRAWSSQVSGTNKGTKNPRTWELSTAAPLQTYRVLSGYGDIFRIPDSVQFLQSLPHRGRAEGGGMGVAHPGLRHFRI